MYPVHRSSYGAGQSLWKAMAQAGGRIGVQITRADSSAERVLPKVIRQQGNYDSHRLGITRTALL